MLVSLCIQFMLHIRQRRLTVSLMLPTMEQHMVLCLDNSAEANSAEANQTCCPALLH